MPSGDHRSPLRAFQLTLLRTAARIAGLSVTVAPAFGCTSADAPACDAVCADARGYDVVAYDVHASFDASARVLRASVDVALHRDAPSRTRLTFDSRVARVIGVTAAGGAPLPFEVNQAAGTLVVDTAPAGAGETLTLTIAYEAALSEALHLSSGRDGDTLGTRTLYTTSEPTLGAYWLPANHRPADRARFSIELEIGDGEDVIANGTRASESKLDGGRKKVRYETSFTLPTYLMAFALGDLVHEDDASGSETPLQVWHRRGAAVDSARQLAAVRGTMRAFEKLLGPYPFESYSVVLLPEHPGGMENASITFLPETSGQTVIGASLGAHELGHQWFGDYVTVNAWEDVWIKEGMATLLAEEASRPYEDSRGLGRLFGNGFGFAPSQPIRDRKTAATNPEALYTSGPYQRGAWLLTQLRALVGEPRFWGTIRSILAAHAFGSVSTTELVAAFAPLVGDAVSAKVAASIDAQGAPSLRVTSVDTAAGARALTWLLDDPSSTLIAPLEITVVDAAGVATTTPVRAGAPVTVVVPAGGYIAPDERDVHPDGAFIGDVEGYREALANVALPGVDGPALQALLARSAAAQEHALAYGPLATTPEAFAVRYAALGSDEARLASLDAACTTLKAATAQDPQREAWLGALGPLLSAPPTESENFLRNVPECGVDLASRTFGAELASRVADAAGPSAGAARLSYLMSFDFGAQASFDAFAPVADSPANAALRDEALARLARQADPAAGFALIAAEDAPRWKAFFRAKMEQSTTFRYLRQTYYGALGLHDEAALPILARKLTSIPVAAAWQVRFVCGAREIARGSDAAWAAFRDALPSQEPLAAAARDALADPSKCP